MFSLRAVSAAVAHLVYTEEVGGSNPSLPIFGGSTPTKGKIGRSVLGQLVVVVHTDRNDKIRIISARKATRAERSQYER